MKTKNKSVMNRAMTMAGPAFFQGYDEGEYDPENEEQQAAERSEWEKVPFSWRGAKMQIEVMRYWNRGSIDRYSSDHYKPR